MGPVLGQARCKVRWQPGLGPMGSHQRSQQPEAEQSPVGHLETGGPLKSVVLSGIHPGVPHVLQLGMHHPTWPTQQGQRELQGVPEGASLRDNRSGGWGLQGSSGSPALSGPQSPPTGHHEGGTRAATPHETVSPDAQQVSSTNTEEPCSSKSPPGPWPGTSRPEGGPLGGQQESDRWRGPPFCPGAGAWLGALGQPPFTPTQWSGATRAACARSPAHRPARRPRSCQRPRQL